MPTYIGFSTIGAYKPQSQNMTVGIGGGTGTTTQPIIPGKKFRIVDNDLVLQDFINAFNIKQGTKVGRPGYGTRLWDYVFDPNTGDVIAEIQEEIRRVANTDPRITIATISVYPKDNGILVELEMAVVPFNQAQLISIFLNQQTGTASLS